MFNFGGNVANLMDHPMVMKETWEQYTQDEHQRWSILFKRQEEILATRAAAEVLDGMKKLEICDFQIPKFSEINKILMDATGFSVVPVTGLIPADLFFHFLAARKFPSTCFLRSPQKMDYLQEPDVFHDVFGHVPLLVNPVFADLMEVFGRKGIEAIKMDLYRYAASLYWFTIEFGLINTQQGLKIYGAGITSSPGESVYSVESSKPNRLKFDAMRAMKTLYRIDRFQQSYFVINDYKQVINSIKDLDWKELKQELIYQPDIEEGIVVNPSELI